MDFHRLHVLNLHGYLRTKDVNDPRLQGDLAQIPNALSSNVHYHLVHSHLMFFLVLIYVTLRV